MTILPEGAAVAALTSLLAMDGAPPIAVLDGAGALVRANRAAALAWDADCRGDRPLAFDGERLAAALAQIVAHPEREVLLDCGDRPLARLRAIAGHGAVALGDGAAGAAMDATTRWQVALDNSDEGLWDWDASTNTVYFSEVWKAHLGYRGAEIGDTFGEWESRVHPDDRDAAFAALRRHFDGRDAQYALLHRMRHKDGSWRWILARGKVAAWNPDGSPRRVIGTHRDVTREQEARLALEQARSALHDFISAVPAHACVLAPDGTIVQTNQPWDDHYAAHGGGDSARLVGSNYFAACEAGEDGAGEGAPVAAAIREVVAGRSEGHASVYPCHGMDAERWFDLRVAPLPGPPPRSVVVWHLDITARVLANERLTRVAAHVPGVIYQYRLRDDGSSHFPYASEGIRDIYGVSPDEVREDATPVFARLHPDDLARVAASIDESARTLEPWRCEYRVRFEDGREIWVEGYATPRREPGATSWHGYITDITQRKTTELALAKAMADLGTYNRDLEDFASIASHDLQEPLRKIRLFGGRLLEAAASLDAEHLDYLERMVAAAGRMSDLIDDLLVYARAGAEPAASAPVPLGPLVTGVLGDLEARVEATGARIAIGPLPVVAGESSQLRQVFQNLIGNALKFVVAGRQPEIAIRAAPAEPPPGSAGAWCEISVADNGIGFDPAQTGLIFAPFRRLHARAAYEGTGIGLAIVRRVVERHGGSIVPEPRPGEGVTFRLRLPLHPGT